MNEQDLKNIMDKIVKKNPELQQAMMFAGKKLFLRLFYLATFFFLLGFIISRLIQ